MKFGKISNSEKNCYDNNSFLVGISSGEYKTRANQHLYEQLFDLIGIFDDLNEEELMETYGITIYEYLNPTQETIRKVSERVSEFGSRKGR